MKKSLIALAVAGTFAAPAAFAATANVDVYGRMNVSIEDSNQTYNNGEKVTMQVTDRQSFIGFKGSEDLGGGLKAIWQIEQTISGNRDGVGDGALANRNSFVGLSGGFGTVLAGRHDTPYKLSTGRLDLFSDTLADYNGDGGALAAGGGVGAKKSGFTQLVEATHDHRSNNAVAYISPSFSGLTVAAAVVMTNRQGDGVLDNQGNKTFDATSLSASYANGPLFLTAAYQKAQDLTIAAGKVSSPAWKFGAGYSFGDAKVGFIYEDVEVKAGGLKYERDSWAINGAYAMGPITLKAQYGRVDNDDDIGVFLDDKQTKTSVGVDYSLSKRTTAGFAYTTDKTKDGSGRLNAWGVQMRHSF